jgi:hypothetical protein
MAVHCMRILSALVAGCGFQFVEICSNKMTCNDRFVRDDKCLETDDNFELGCILHIGSLDHDRSYLTF